MVRATRERVAERDWVKCRRRGSSATSRAKPFERSATAHSEKMTLALIVFISIYEKTG